MILEAAALVPHVQFKLVGGDAHECSELRRRLTWQSLRNVEILERLYHRDVPEFLWNTDVALVPQTPEHSSSQWTSPLKMLEYFGSETLVVASDIPALRFWVSDDAPVNRRRLRTIVRGTRQVSARRDRRARSRDEYRQNLPPDYSTSSFADEGA